MDTLVGTSTGRYQITRQVGTGGMSIVYAAFDRELGFDVALKVLKPEHAKGEAAQRRRTRLLREARALELVSHPNVVRVFNSGEIGDLVFVAMELIDGWSLRDWLREAPRSRGEIIDVYSAAGRGLEAAHAKGLVHRDFKPGNVLIGRDGRVVVTDFGLVRLGAQGDEAPTQSYPPNTEGSGRTGVLGMPLTLPGAVLGTPGYMAPEQIQGRATDQRTDQFGFAVALWDALYGELPFSTDVEGLPPEMAVALEAVQGRIRPAPKGSDVPEVVRKVMMRALSVEADDRFRTMNELLGELARAKVAAGITTVRVEPPAPIYPQRSEPLVSAVKVTPVRPRMARGPIIALVVSIAVLAAGALAYGHMQSAAIDPCRISAASRGALENAGPAYVAEWTGAHDSVCGASAAPDASRAPVLACLELRLRELELLDRERANTDPRVADLLQLGLTPPAKCAKEPNTPERFSRWIEAARSVVRSGELPRDLGTEDLRALGSIALTADRPATAVTCFEQAHDDEGRVVALIARAAAHRSARRYSAAEDDLRAALKLSKNARASYALGDLLIETNRADEALPFLSSARELSRGMDAKLVADVLADLALATAAGGDRTAAADLAEQARAMVSDPSIPPARRARVKFIAAKLLGSTPLARQARAELEGLDGMGEARAMIDDWLASAGER